MSINDTNKYKQEYNKENYTICKAVLRQREAQILANYSLKTGLSKSALLVKCLIFCYNNGIDPSYIELSKPEK